jgi:MFS-type transporter involved in bile tolerance (Atg22 family)
LGLDTLRFLEHHLLYQNPDLLLSVLARCGARERGEAVFNFAVAVSVLLLFFTAPVLGVMAADLRQRRVPYLVVLTLISVLLTVLLDVAGGS